MRRFAAVLCLLWCVTWAALSVYGAVSNPLATSFKVQGPDATGNAGYPLAVVQATGSTWTESGGLTNNAAAPGATNIGVLGALANASAPSWTEGRQVLFSSTLTGDLRTTGVGGTFPVTQSTSPWVVSGGLTNNNAAPAGTNVGSLTALANAASPSWTEGREVLASVDLSGNQRVTLGTLLAGEDQTLNRLATCPEYSYSNIATSTTTTVKSGAGVLHTIVINTRSITGGTCTVYDNTAGSGTKIATIDTTLSTTFFLYDVTFSTGLTVVTAGGATPPDISISYL